MTDHPQTVSHLDADQLSAFAEGVLSTPERELCMAHLAECAHCREVVFLARAAMPAPEPVPQVVRPSWRSWWPVLSLSGAAIAAAVVLAIALRHGAPSTAPPAQVAVAHPPAPASPPPLPLPQPKSPTPKPKGELPPARPPALPEPTVPAEIAARTPTTDDGTVASANLSAARLNSASEMSPMAGKAAGAALPSAAPTVTQAQDNVTLATNRPAQPDARPSSPLRSARSMAIATSLAGVSGLITDQTGAVIPQAHISFDQVGGTAHREATSDAQGRFIVASLPPGKYRTEISSPGFERFTQELQLGANEIAQLDMRLQVGAASQTVEVSAANAVLDTESASLAATLPSSLPAQSTISSGKRTLSLDSAGTLFLGNSKGRHWKPVHGPWKGGVTAIALSSDQRFLVTTNEGCWLSPDGKHWTPSP